MANNFLSKYHAFNPKTVLDLLISPYTNGCEVIGRNGTRLYHNGKQWIVIKKGIVTNGFMETDKEDDAVDAFWRYEAQEEHDKYYE